MNIGQIVELDNSKKYIIVDKINLHNTSYLYLITQKSPVQILILTEKKDGDEIILNEVKDNDELDYVLSQFSLTQNN